MRTRQYACVPSIHPRRALGRLPRLLVISGPIAAGKSTLAVEVTRRLRELGLSVALVDLDAIAEMALPTLPDWAWAHRIHAETVGAWLRTGIDMVVDEGTSTPGEIRQVLDHVPEGTAVFHVVLHAEYERALARAQADPSRGISKDPEFLRRAYDGFAAVAHLLPADLRLDVESEIPERLADAVILAIDV